jgi:hypothetical protein
MSSKLAVFVAAMVVIGGAGAGAPVTALAQEGVVVAQTRTATNAGTIIDESTNTSEIGKQRLWVATVMPGGF